VIPARVRRHTFNLPGSAIPATAGKPHPTRQGHAFHIQMKKNNGYIAHGRGIMDYAAAAMELYCMAHPGSPSGVRRPQLFFRGDFGSRCLVQAWKKGLLGSALLSPRPCAPLMRNTLLDCIHQLTRSAGMADRVERRKLSEQCRKVRVLPGRHRGLSESFKQFEG